MNNKYYLGIDTSNYTTSVAAVDENRRIIFDSRQLLRVKKGERGLRQSQALFEHISNLPGVISGLYKACEAEGLSLGGVSVSTRPRPVEGSYMPCFKAGETAARAIAETHGVDCAVFSHQEGHIAAAMPAAGAAIGKDEAFIALHLSGGTTEVLLVNNGNIEVTGGSRDISLGQLVDRTGVSLGLDFPCGKELDSMAVRLTAETGAAELRELIKANPFCRIKAEEAFLNISGIETQIQRYIKNNCAEIDSSLMALWVLERAGEALYELILQACVKTGKAKVLCMGGVSSSELIRRIIRDKQDAAAESGREVLPEIFFGEAAMCSDNAVGIALLGADFFCGR